jgi:hypothetical protein
MLEITDVMHWAVEKAKKVFYDCGYHENILIGYTESGTEVIGLNYHDDIEKEAELRFARWLFSDVGVQAYVHIAEAWVVKLEKGESLEAPPSKSPKRREVLIVMAISKTQKLACHMGIRRDGDKVWLEEGEIEESPNVSGPFTELLEEEPKVYS